MRRRTNAQPETAQSQPAEDHGQTEALIDAYLDRELSDAESADLLSRVMRDPEQLDRLMTEQTLADEIRMSQAWAPLHLTARIRMRLGVSPEPRAVPARRRFIIRLRRAGLAAAAVMAISAGLWLRADETNPSIPQFTQPAPIQVERLANLIHDDVAPAFSPFDRGWWIESSRESESFPVMTGVLLYSVPARALKHRGAILSQPASLPSEIRSNTLLEPPMSGPVKLEDLVLPDEGELATGPMNFV